MSTPSVLFACVRNSGKSQMAAALMRRAAGDRVTVYSAGTDPGSGLNPLAVQAVEELGTDLAGEAPKPVDPHLLTAVDLVVVLGREARLDTAADIEVRTWDIDEPSLRGIDGVERMRLVRDDIATHVDVLLPELLPLTIHYPIHLSSIGSCDDRIPDSLDRVARGPVHRPARGVETAATRWQREFDGTFGTETIEAFLHSSYEQFVGRATIVNFLPLLAERFARQRLHASTKVEGLTHTGTPAVLFLYAHNAGRSRWHSVCSPTSPANTPSPGPAIANPVSRSILPRWRRWPSSASMSPVNIRSRGPRKS